MRPRGPQDKANMGSREAWGSLGPLLGGLGHLLTRSGRLLELSWELLGHAWPPGARLGLIWASRVLLELFGPLLKAPLRNRENHEIR